MASKSDDVNGLVLLQALTERLEDTLGSVFISPNELDRNWESANMVDGLFAIARALEHVAAAIEKHGEREETSPAADRPTSRKES